MFNFSLETRWKLDRLCARELITSYVFLRGIASYSIFLNRKKRDKYRMRLYFNRGFAVRPMKGIKIYLFVCYFRALFFAVQCQWFNSLFSRETTVYSGQQIAWVPIKWFEDITDIYADLCNFNRSLIQRKLICWNVQLRNLAVGSIRWLVPRELSLIRTLLFG